MKRFVLGGPMRRITHALALLLALAGTALATAFGFGTSSQIAVTNTASQWACCGSFKNNGKLDVCAIGALTNLSYLPGNGDGTFGTKSDLTTAGGSTCVACADLRNNGKLDLVVCSGATTNFLSTFLGNGDGTFGARADVACTHPSFVALGDLDGDGKPDAVVVSFSDNNVKVLINNGSGAFGAPTNFTTGTNPAEVALADVDGDGKLDIVTANYGAATISVLLGNGAGSFGAKHDYTSVTGCYGVVIGDVNHDGFLDVVTSIYGATGTGNQVSVMLNTGAGQFPTHTEYTTQTVPLGIALADFNGDGLLDIVTCNYTGANSVSVLLGVGDGSFPSHTEYTIGGTQPTHNPVIGDFNGDGKLDIVTPNTGSSNFSILLQNTTDVRGLNYAFGSPHSVLAPLVKQTRTVRGEIVVGGTVKGE